MGAGVLLRGGYVLTCAHVVLPESDWYVKPPPLDRVAVYADFPGDPLPSPPLRARLMRDYLVQPTREFTGDLAVLKLETEPSVPYATLHQQILGRGDLVHITGYPENVIGGEHETARLNARGGPARWPEWVQLDPEGNSHSVQHGYSGAGAVHERSRQVIGIVVYRTSERVGQLPNEHSYVIPTDTILRHLQLDSLPVQVTGSSAVSSDIMSRRSSTSRAAPGLRRWLTRWLDREEGTGDVVIAFTGGDGGGREADTWQALRSTLALADPEHDARQPAGNSSLEPQAGTIDIAEDAERRTMTELATKVASRSGLAMGLDDEVLPRIADESPPLAAAFLSIDRSPDGEGIMELLLALRHSEQRRLLLTFHDRESPLVRRVCEELMGADWHTRWVARVRGKIVRLEALEQWTKAAEAPHKALERALNELCEAGPDSDLMPYRLFRLDLDVEDALLRTAVPKGSPSDDSADYLVFPPGDELTALPIVSVRDPGRLARRKARSDQESQEELRLSPGEVLHEQYSVVGPLARGSYGQVYLAHDKSLEDREVALKGLRHPDRDKDVQQAHMERQLLVELNHPSIIRVINYAKPPKRNDEFIVMEFANGGDLWFIASLIAQGHPQFSHAERVREFIASYGLRVLEALSYLHDQRLVYGDLSLGNVMHCGNGIKLIDVAAVRPSGTPGPCTIRPPEAGEEGIMTARGDLYCLGKILRELLDRVPQPPEDLGTQSLDRILTRATADRPATRFANAREMRDQLRGVLRELRSLRLHEETFEPSKLFDPGSKALDGQLGSAPPLSQWAPDGAGRPSLGRVPEPSDVAVGLPMPRPAPSDRNIRRLQRISYDDPEGLLQRSEGWQPKTRELHLLRCRLYLRLADSLDDARDELVQARRCVGARPSLDWRLAWHHGLISLAGGARTGDSDHLFTALEEARGHFDDVYRDIPGEYAPKLALGYCHEKLAERERDPEKRGGHLAQAIKFYGAVWRRNRDLGSAAFGLARIQLAQDRFDEALQVLKDVPPGSGYRTAARLAIVRIHASARTVAHAQEACKAWYGLIRHEGFTDREARTRLNTDLLERLFDLVFGSSKTETGRKDASSAAEPHPLLVEIHEAAPGAEVPRTERDLRRALSDAYRKLTAQVPRSGRREDAVLAETLLDNAIRIRRPPDASTRLPGWLRRRPAGSGGGGR